MEEWQIPHSAKCCTNLQEYSVQVGVVGLTPPVLLNKSIHRLWENSKHVAKQLDKIGDCGSKSYIRGFCL